MHSYTCTVKPDRYYFLQLYDCWSGQNHKSEAKNLSVLEKKSRKIMKMASSYGTSVMHNKKNIRMRRMTSDERQFIIIFSFSSRSLPFLLLFFYHNRREKLSIPWVLFTVSFVFVFFSCFSFHLKVILLQKPNSFGWNANHGMGLLCSNT